MASNILAAVLTALVPGLGQFYKGHFWRGLLFFLTWWTVVMYIVGIVDAYMLDN
jgi:TM2 domain-containing membrane protein YozV